MNALLGMAGAASGDEQLDVMDVFSAYSYLGNGGTIELNTGIDYTKGALIWTKNRGNTSSHILVDTERGADKYLSTDTASAETIAATAPFTSFGNNSVQAQTNLVNTTGNSYVSWHFRKSKRFFDVVTYTGNGIEGRDIFHGLGVEPGMVIIKRTSATDNWYVYHRSVGLSSALNLNGTSAPFTLSQAFLESTDKYFKLGVNTAVNGAGISYVAYFFAHDTASDSCISCDTYTGYTPKFISVGFEPQFLMVRNLAGGNWEIYDTNRGVQDEVNVPILYPNSTSAETTRVDISLNPDGFDDRRSGTYIYLAIRHTNTAPTKPSKVVTHQFSSGTGTSGYIDSNFSPDVFLSYTGSGSGGSYGTIVVDKKAAVKDSLSTVSTSAGINFNNLFFDNGSGIRLSSSSYFNESASLYTRHYLRRAKKFFESTLYIGTGSFRTVSHRLGVAPELAIFKCLDASYGWGVYCSHISVPENNLTGINSVLYLNTNAAAVGTDFTWWADSSGYRAPNANSMYLGSSGIINQSGLKYHSMYFSSCPGISKVGAYTGNGTNITLNFTFIPSLIIIKCVSASGSWWVWEGLRKSGLNHSVNRLEVANSTIYVTDTFNNESSPYSMTVSQSTTTNLNVSDAKYIYLAIA